MIKRFAFFIKQEDLEHLQETGNKAVTLYDMHSSRYLDCLFKENLEDLAQTIKDVLDEWQEE